MKTFNQTSIPVTQNEIGDPVINMQADKLSAEGGSTLITGTNVVTGNFYCFIVNSEAVINTVYRTKVGDSTSNHVAKPDITGQTLGTGMYYSAGRIGTTPTYFDSIQLTSGSVIAYSL